MFPADDSVEGDRFTGFIIQLFVLSFMVFVLQFLQTFNDIATVVFSPNLSAILSIQLAPSRARN